jgi:hypothetical protein
MFNLSDNNALTGVFSNPALTGLSGGATTYSLTAFPFALDGILFTRAVVSGGTTPTTNSTSNAALSATAPASGFRGALVVWTVDSGSTVRVRSRGFVTSLSGDPVVLEFPEIPATEVPFAYHTIKAGTTVSGTWTFGSSNWNAAGITIGTVANTASLPSSTVVLN